MDLKRKRILFFGCRLLLWAMLFRLFALEIPGHMGRIQRQNIVQTESETGQNVRFSASLEKLWDHFRESAVPGQAEAERPRFDRGAGGKLRITGKTADVDAEELLSMPLEWDLVSEEPRVLILHTHTTESYTPGEEPYVSTAEYRTLDESRNMLSVGDLVARLLARQGICVIHDRQIHDYPSYSTAYGHARRSVEAILEENPGIRLVLDLHRDASGTDGKQLRTMAEIGGQTAAQLMLVVGTGTAALPCPGWKENLALAAKLQLQLEAQSPGITRPICLRSARYNQDLLPGMLLVEVGAAGNTRQEALLAARQLAAAVAALAKGTGE